MHEVRIYFAGVCTFLEGFSEFTPLKTDPPIRRMVLVNANVSSITMGGNETVTVAPHRARLRVHTRFHHVGHLPPRVGDSPDVFDLNGPSAYTITVQGPITPVRQESPWLDDARCLPSLQGTLKNDMKIGQPSLAVLTGDDAACYVDFTHGVIHGIQTHKQMGIARVTIFTESEPRLAITRAGASATVTLTENPAVISFTNKPDPPGGDGRDDFYLNFLLLPEKYRPRTQDVSIPTGVKCHTQDPDVPRHILHDDAGPGCSTTDFP